jgi:integrase/recombinase XerD
MSKMLRAKQQADDQDYDYDNRIRRHLANCEERLSQSDFKLVLKYHEQMILTTRKVATISKNLEVIASLSNMIDQEWTTMTRESINTLVANAMIKYSDNGQETHATYDHKKILKMFFRFVKRGNRLHKKVGTPDELFDIEQREVPNKLAREDMVTDQDIAALIAVSLNPRDKAMWAVMYESGNRIGEFCSVRMKHVFRDTKGFLIAVDGKTNARKIRLHTSQVELAAWINTHPFKDDPEAWLWVTLDGKFNRMKPDAVRMQLNKTKKRAGITKRIFPHLFRHSEITRLVLKVPDLAMKARHGLAPNSKMLSRYSHLNQDDLDDCYLGAIGAKVPENKEPERSLVTCGKCQTVNAPETDLCISCQLPLTMQTAIMMDDKTAHDKEAFIADIVPKLLEKVHESMGLKKKLTKADLAKMTQEEKDKILEELAS